MMTKAASLIRKAEVKLDELRSNIEELKQLRKEVDERIAALKAQLKGNELAVVITQRILGIDDSDD